MIIVILCVLGLFVLQTLLPAIYRYLLAGPGAAARLMIALGPRDAPPPLSAVGGRAERALTNLHEALPVFLTLALLLLLRDAVTELALRGAWIFFLARALYVPAYLGGIFAVRSAVWVVSWVGLGMMIAALLAPH